MAEPCTNEDLIRAAFETVEAIEAYQAGLRTNAVLLRELVVRLGAGESVREVMKSMPGASTRVAAVNAEADLVNARTRYRVALVAASLALGMSRKEIAASMGCSRQLVDRYIKAAQESREFLQSVS